MSDYETEVETRPVCEKCGYIFKDFEYEAGLHWRFSPNACPGCGRYITALKIIKPDFHGNIIYNAKDSARA